MLNFKIDTTAYSELDDNLKALYTETADGYQLQVNGVADPAEVERLRAHNEKVLAEKKAQQEQAKQAEAERLKAEQEAARKSGDFEKLEQSLKAQLEKERQDKEALLREREKDLLERESRNIVRELTDNQNNQDLLQEFVLKRLKVNNGAVQVVGSDGQTELDAKTLINEFKTCGRYDSLITGTKASGSGASGQSGNHNKSASEYTEAERLELATKNPELFKQLFN